ncbi:hypothetical protein D3C87_1794780 [compost metagenome]
MKTYNEAIESGFTKREAGYIAGAEKLVAMLDEFKEERTEFLTARGLTWDDAKSLSPEAQAELSGQWIEYKVSKDLPAPGR